MTELTGPVDLPWLSPLAGGTPGRAEWRPDPFGRFRSRWWDGAAWTWQVSDGAGVQWDAAPLEDRPPPPPGLRSLGVALWGYLIGVALALVVQLGLWALGHPGGRLAALPLSEAGLWAGFVGACLVVSRRRGSASLRTDFGLRVRPVDLGLGLAASVVGRVLATSGAAPFAPLLPRSRHLSQSTFQQVAHGTWGWVVVVAVVCVGAPLVEELFFRGLVQTRLVGRFGVVAGIVMTSLLFGAAHLIGWTGPVTFLYAWSVACGGLALGTARHLTGRLGTSMIAHMAFNAQALVVLALVGR